LSVCSKKIIFIFFLTRFQIGIENKFLSEVRCWFCFYQKASALDFLIIFVKNLQTLEQSQIVSDIRTQGIAHIKEGNGKVISIYKPEVWSEEMGFEGVYLLFDIFQIRSICEPFSEVSLDVVEYASKPTIYHSQANKLLKSGPIQDGILKFALIREPSWNRLLFELSQPVIVNLVSSEAAVHKTDLLFPLFSPGSKELFLSADGDVKIIKG